MYKEKIGQVYCKRINDAKNRYMNRNCYMYVCAESDCVDICMNVRYFIVATIKIIFFVREAAACPDYRIASFI